MPANTASACASTKAKAPGKPSCASAPPKMRPQTSKANDLPSAVAFSVAFMPKVMIFEAQEAQELCPVERHNCETCGDHMAVNARICLALLVTASLATGAC